MIFVYFLVFICSFFFYGAYFLSSNVLPDLDYAAKVKIDIPSGRSMTAIADQFKDEGIIDSVFSLRLFSFILGVEDCYKAGHFIIDSDMMVYDVIYKMVNGITDLIKIQLPEGLSNYQVIDRIMSDSDYNGVINDLTDLPTQYLFPSTYYFEKYSKMSEIINFMSREGSEAVSKALNGRKMPPKINNVEKLLILASIVEKERGVEDDPRIIAGVFINRLKINMRLDSDPTLIFALTGGSGNLERRLTDKDKLYDNPFNTYKKYGLPPQMIANPSLESIIAVLEYAHHNYYYFVSNGYNKHNFATTLAEQNENIKEFKRVQRAKRFS
ncbi:endolytic transglycosylase MltG [Anaplasmataceae bacterium AB001_6]|nr:endolytic transglycosylase MltG [Anaplasmataceae bacterium AB001_6]